MTRRQCRECPWRVDVDPHQIPNGYRVDLHRSLTGTIAEPGVLPEPGTPLRVFACHESQPGAELPCVGWLVHQLGPGNNLGLRLAVIHGRIDADVEPVGEQHQSLEATLPGRT